MFEDEPEFSRWGLEISPLHLPLRARGPVRFDELLLKNAFHGLPGVLADALPDAFGTTVIRAFYTSRGEERKALSPVQHLLYVGVRAVGALEFHAAEKLPRRAAEAAALEVAQLVADARRIIAGEADVTVPEIYRIGSSAGGMRPKAVVLHNAASGAIRSAFATPEPGDVPCILKFDGVGEVRTARLLGEPQPFNRVEAAYARMARAAGLDVVAATPGDERRPRASRHPALRPARRRAAAPAHAGRHAARRLQRSGREQLRLRSWRASSRRVRARSVRAEAGPRGCRRPEGGRAVCGRTVHAGVSPPVSRPAFPARSASLPRAAVRPAHSPSRRRVHPAPS